MSGVRCLYNARGKKIAVLIDLEHNGVWEDLLDVALPGTCEGARTATMSDPSTTTLSSKGQVVIPEEIRERLGLKAGAEFVVLGDKDVVIFKILRPPAKRDFTALVQRARKVAKQTGMRRADITTAVSKTRRARRPEAS